MHPRHVSSSNPQSRNTGSEFKFRVLGCRALGSVIREVETDTGPCRNWAE